MNKWSYSYLRGRGDVKRPPKPATYSVDCGGELICSKHAHYQNFLIYSLLSPIAVTDGPYGGYGGNPWSDGPLSTNEDITAIEIREGHILDAIRVRYLIN